jgi:hypothetical protein
MTALYLHELLEHQRVYDSIDNRLFNDVNVTHVFVSEGVYWGCAYPTKGNVLKREINRATTRSELVVDDGKSIAIHHHITKPERVYVPVNIDGEEWMSVHRVSEFDTWVKTDGTDAAYQAALHELGIRDHEFKFTRANKPAERDHVEPIPFTGRDVNEGIIRPKLSPKLLVLSMADGYTTDGFPWFGTRECYDAALSALRKTYPPKKRSKAQTSVVMLTGTAMGYDEDSQSKSHMRQGWYIQVLK